MITIVKKCGQNVSFSRVEWEQYVEMMLSDQSDVDVFSNKVCYVSEIVKQHGHPKVMRLSGLCHLELLNLPGRDEVEEKFQMACLVPYSMMVYRGSDGRSLHIVCRYDWQHADGMPNKLDEATMLRYLSNAYKQLHYAYSVQLNASLDNAEPSLTQKTDGIRDPAPYINATSQVLYVSDRDIRVPVFKIPTTGMAGQVPLCSESQFNDQCERYEWAYRRALAEARQRVSNRDEAVECTLSLLAAYCHEDGIEQEIAVRRTLWKADYWDHENHVRMVFANAYEEELTRIIPYGSVERSALMMMRLESFVGSRYQLRRNVLTGVVEFRERSSYYYSFSPLTQSDVNSITTAALKMGLGSWDKDLRRLLDSKDIPVYDPLYDYLSNLPQWDGEDHVGEFTRRIPTDTPHYDYYLHIWLRSMVAHWLGKDRRHGNALVPLLIGGQGCGKTSLCNILLPRELQTYYNDNVSFRSEADLMTALSNFALINIDEFDSIKRSQQPVLKYLLSKSDVKFRPPYGKAIVERRRYASFIATTNLRHPLRDTTGSRRFACILVRDGKRIDYTTPLHHDQLFAQLMHEIDRGERYWLNDEETAELQHQNADFLMITDEAQIIDSLFTVVIDPSVLDNHKSEQWRSVDQIIDIIVARYPHIQRSQALNQRVGSMLKAKGFASRKTNSCMKYCVYVR